MGAVESALVGPGANFTVGRYHVTRIKQMAEGGFSYVDLVSDDDRPKTFYALKRILCQTPEQVESAKSEISLHQSISHPFVLSLLDSAFIPARHSASPQAQEALLLFPLYPKGSIADAVQRYLTEDEKAFAAAVASSRSPSSPSYVPAAWPFPEHEALRLFYAVAQGMQAIHAQGVAHRDIKPHNVLLAYSSSAADSNTNTAASSSSPSSSSLSDDPTPIIIDLGSASPLITCPSDRRSAFALQDHASEIATSSFRAPELFEVRVGVEVDERADLWSLACTLYYMMFGASPFEDEVEGVMTLAIKQGAVRFPQHLIREDEEDDSPVFMPPSTAPSASSPSPSSSSSSSPPRPIHATRLCSPSFVQFLRELLVADPAMRPTLREAMKKSVVLMSAALDREQRRKEREEQRKTDQKDAADVVDDEDEFGDFASASPAIIVPTGAALDLLLTELELGSPPAALTKYGRKGQPHATKLKLSRDRRTITWTSKGGNKVNKLPLSRVLSIVLCQKTTKFARFASDPSVTSKSHLCFSLLLKPEMEENGKEEKEQEKEKETEKDGDAATDGTQAEAIAEKSTTSPSPSDQPTIPSNPDPATWPHTLDLQADSHQTLRTWTQGIQAIITQIKEGDNGGSNTVAEPSPSPSPSPSP